MRSPYGEPGWLVQSPSGWLPASSSTFQSPSPHRSAPYAGIPLTLSAPPVDHYHTEWSYQPTHYSLVVAMINHWAQKLRRVSNHLRRETLAEAWQLWHDLIVEERLSKRLADAALLMRASDSPRPVQRRASRPATRALRSPEATPSPSRKMPRAVEELPKIQVLETTRRVGFGVLRLGRLRRPLRRRLATAMAKWREFILPAAVHLTLTAMKGVRVRARSWQLLCTGEEELKEQLRIAAAAQEASAMQHRRLSRLHCLGARLMAGALRSAAQRTKADTFAQWRRKAQLCPPRPQDLQSVVRSALPSTPPRWDLARVEQNAMPVPFEKDMVDKESISSPLTHESRPFPDLTEHLENAAPQLLQHSGNAEAAMGELRKAVNQALQESSSRSRPSPGVALPQLQGDFAEAQRQALEPHDFECIRL
ncbi:hypothetical protein AK812_SmicGene6463 [Symbiodinium microadriaticum]|uniref:Uncharacterized protein n=1 Tax=Symbiodinium microadriaticum TaxID=2951 RepID=A0A1Q9ER53_SYMMI|nr:hypothetical protein AK812_SmicGene6463 [Symbiodinium microadriaticum]